MMKRHRGFLGQISWPLVALQLLAVLGLILLIERVFGPMRSERAALYGVAIYFAYSIASRQLLAGSFQRGMRLLKKGRYEDAIPAFEKSYGFFEEHPWLDRLRCITMMSPCVSSYREMALVNIAMCYGQMGDVESSRSYFQKALDEFPGSMSARVGLNTIRVFEDMRKRTGA